MKWNRSHQLHKGSRCSLLQVSHRSSIQAIWQIANSAMLHFQRSSHDRTLLLHGVASLTSHLHASTTSRWSSSICRIARRQVRFQCLFSLCCPQRSCPFALIAFELLDNPYQRAEDRGAIIAGQVHDTGFNDETAQFDEVPRALAALDLPRAHVMPRLCGLMPVARRPVAPECRQRCGQLLTHFAALGFERKRPRAWPMPPVLRPPSSRPAPSGHRPVHRR